MSLVTDDDVVFPGENWFLYWRTSASLWRAKLQERTGRIIVPLNWAFHSETGDQYDFANSRPETDLKKLTELACELGREVTFLLPLTPAPFLPNGGVPHFLARCVASCEQKISYGVIDAGGTLNKMYSFFDQRIYQAYAKYVKELGKYFTREGIVSDIWGMECGYFQEGEFKSYFVDRSSVFERGFRQYIELRAQENDCVINSSAGEREAMEEFEQTIRNLYIDSASQALAANWEGSLRFSFVGGNFTNFIERLFDHSSTSSYSRDIFKSICHDAVPSSILLSPALKRGVLKRQFDELVGQSFLKAKLKDSGYREDEVFFEALYFFSISSETATWKNLFLMDYVQEKYPWVYRVSDHKGMPEILEDGEYEGKIYFLTGESLENSDFAQMLRLFMSGGKIVLNKSGLSEVLERRLEGFILENNLQTEKVNFLLSINNISLGAGRMVIFNGEELAEYPADKRVLFWQTLLETFEILHMPVETPNGVDHFWGTRQTTSAELKYEEIRRLNLYNHTSYKKRIKLGMVKNIVLTKVLDAINCQVQSLPNEIEIEMLPEGSVALDFGVYH